MELTYLHSRAAVVISNSFVIARVVFSSRFIAAIVIACSRTLIGDKAPPATRNSNEVAQKLWAHLVFEQ